MRTLRPIGTVYPKTGARSALYIGNRAVIVCPDAGGGSHDGSIGATGSHGYYDIIAIGTTTIYRVIHQACTH